MEFLHNFFGSLVSLFFSILYIAIGYPLKKRKIKRNYWYGFRIKYTLEDDEIWYEVNELLGRDMVYQGYGMGIIGLLGFATYLVPWNTIGQVIILCLSMAILTIGIIYSLVRGIKIMNKMALEKGLKEKREKQK
jgi:hypothetical protein